MELLLILFLIVINGVFAMSEIAVVSARKSRLRHLAENGDKQAQAALDLANEPDRFLSTVQVGITLIGILAGAFGGSTIAKNLQAELRKIDPLSEYADVIGFGIIVVITTYLSLVIGELVPKRLALQNPERVAARVAQPMQMLSMLAAPVVTFLTLSTQGILWLLQIKDLPEQPVTDEEITALIRHGTRTGAFEEAEREMVAGVLRLDDLRADMIMTPRTEIIWLDVDDPLENNLRKIGEHNFSNYPVGNKSIDHIIGVVRVKDLYNHTLSGEALDLQAIVQEPLFVPESRPVSEVLESFKRSGKYVALVIGEYGDVQGLITLIDVLAEIVADVDLDEPQVVTRKDGSMLVDGLLPIHRLKEIMDVKSLPGEDERDFQSLGGFVMSHMGRVPKAADSFDWDGWSFEVMDMDGNRVDKVMLKKIVYPSIEVED